MIKKTIVITGAGTGLGREAAILLAKRGHKVIATTRYEKEAENLKKIAIMENLNLESFKLDILSESDRNLLQNLNFNVLINNAAIGDSGSVCEVKVEKFREVFETNVFSNIEISQIALKKFIEKKEGRVIFISSLSGKISIPFLSPYCASKFAIEAFATSLREEMKLIKGINIQIGIIAPGAYATGFNKQNIEKKYKWMYKKSYFKNNLTKLKEVEERIWKSVEYKNYNSIIKQYIRAVEDKKVKRHYTAPKFQAFFTQLGKILGI